jgi:hypothetical protein
MQAKSRQWLIRGAVAVLWIVLGVVIFIFNRGHQLLIDNHGVDSLSLTASDSLKLSLNNGKKVEFYRNDRDIFDVGGGTQRIRIEFSDGTPPLEARFKLPLKDDMYLLSLPKLLNQVEPYYEPFIVQGDEAEGNDDAE